MAVFSDAFQDRENLTKIITLGDYLAVRNNLDARGMLHFVKEGGESGYSVRELKEVDTALRWTRWLDALSAGRRWPLARLVDKLDPMLAEGVALAVAPSHDPFNTETPIRELAQRLAMTHGRVDATGCLVRHTKIQRITFGGPSFVALHEETVRVENEACFFGLPVLLLDDIARTGATLRACRRLLLDAGAAEVQMLALGRVWNG